MLQVVYCNHQTATLSVREKLAFSVEKLQQAYAELRQRFPLAEAVVLSTCNRVEIYTAQESPDSAPTHRELVDFFANARDAETQGEKFEDGLYSIQLVDPEPVNLGLYSNG